MFQEKTMTNTLKWLFSLYDPDEQEDLEDFPFSAVCNALRGQARTVYQYQVDGSFDRCFQYRGRELFGQRAVCLAWDTDSAGCDIMCYLYAKELWMLEDGSCVLTNCVHMDSGNSDYGYSSDYRVLAGTVESEQDLLVSFGELRENLENLCDPQWEFEAAIYAL